MSGYRFKIRRIQNFKKNKYKSNKNININKISIIISILSFFITVICCIITYSMLKIQEDSYKLYYYSINTNQIPLINTDFKIKNMPLFDLSKKTLMISESKNKVVELKVNNLTDYELYDCKVLVESKFYKGNIDEKKNYRNIKIDENKTEQYILYFKFPIIEPKSSSFEQIPLSKNEFNFNKDDPNIYYNIENKYTILYKNIYSQYFLNEIESKYNIYIDSSLVITNKKKFITPKEANEVIERFNKIEQEHK